MITNKIDISWPFSQENQGRIMSIWILEADLAWHVGSYLTSVTIDIYYYRRNQHGKSLKSVLGRQGTKMLILLQPLKRNTTCLEDCSFPASQDTWGEEICRYVCRESRKQRGDGEIAEGCIRPAAILVEAFSELLAYETQEVESFLLSLIKDKLQCRSDQLECIMEDLCDRVARRHYELEIIASQVHPLKFR